MRGRPRRMWSPQERNGMVPRRSDDQGKVPFGQAVLRRRTLVHGTWYVILSQFNALKFNRM